jgi:hypothetical protein
LEAFRTCLERRQPVGLSSNSIKVPRCEISITVERAVDLPVMEYPMYINPQVDSLLALLNVNGYQPTLYASIVPNFRTGAIEILRWDVESYIRG